MNKENWKEEFDKRFCIDYTPCGSKEEVSGMASDINPLIVINFISTLLSQSHQQGRMEMASEVDAEIEKSRHNNNPAIAGNQNDYSFWQKGYNQRETEIQSVLNNLKTNTPTTEVER